MVLTKITAFIDAATDTYSFVRIKKWFWVSRMLTTTDRG